MPLTNQTRPLGGRVGCEMLGRPSHSTLTPIDWRSQLIGSHYCLLPSIARAVSRQLFGEQCHD